MKNHLPPGVNGAVYHAWLECGTSIVDFSTYQLKEKGAQLDAMDGQITHVEWCPDFLVVQKSEISSYREVKKLRKGIFYYEADAALGVAMGSVFIGVDDEDLEHARLIMANPDAKVFGPQTLKSL